MTVFRYQAIDNVANTTTGIVEAKNRTVALKKLAGNGLKVIELSSVNQNGSAEPASGASGPSKFFQQIDNVGIFEELSILLNAGMNIEVALQCMNTGETRSAQQDCLRQLIDIIESGRSVCEAFTEVLDLGAAELALIRSAEQVGRLPSAFLTISVELQKRAARRQEIQNALSYPAFLIFLLIVAIGLIAYVLVPTLLPIFVAANSEPPVLIRTLTRMTVFISDFGLILVAILLCLFFGLRAFTSKQWRRKILQNCVLKLPVFGEFAKKNTNAGFLRSMALLLENGVNMQQALKLAINGVSFVGIREKFIDAENAVISGESLPSALEKTRLFDAKTIGLVNVGSSSNTLPITLSRAATLISSDVAIRVNRIVALITPLVTIILGIVVGGLVLSVMSSLLSINELALQ